MYKSQKEKLHIEESVYFNSFLTQGLPATLDEEFVVNYSIPTKQKDLYD